MLNAHHRHSLVYEVFKWSYEQHLYTHTSIPMVNRFASLDAPLTAPTVRTNEERLLSLLLTEHRIIIIPLSKIEGHIALYLSVGIH